jgi:hypothetical protein
MRATISYFARDGKVFAKTPDGEREVSTALSANGRDLARFEKALDRARAQRRTERRN